MNVVAYSPKTGPVEVKEWMRWSGDYSYIVNGVARLSLSESFWEGMVYARTQKAKNG